MKKITIATLAMLFSLLIVSCPKRENPTFLFNNSEESLQVDVVFNTSQENKFENIKWNAYETKKVRGFFSDNYEVTRTSLACDSITSKIESTVKYVISCPPNKSIVIFRCFGDVEWTDFIKTCSITSSNRKTVPIDKESYDRGYFEMRDVIDQTNGRKTEGKILIIGKNS